MSKKVNIEKLPALQTKLLACSLFNCLKKLPNEDEFESQSVYKEATQERIILHPTLYEWSINVMNKLFLSILYSIFQYFFDLHGMMPRDTR